ncbi:MAG: hypothetical protein JW867_07320 [Candidatus Omnitrophica bacterium]|nr:hypothetical protein [Candidatus Omnitrophota bacterium]
MMKVLAVLFLLIISLPVFGERVVFKSGEVVDGQLLYMTADEITLEVFGVPTTYSLQDVESIDGKLFSLPPKLKPQEQYKEASAQAETEKKKSESLRMLEEALSESKADKDKTKTEAKTKPGEKDKVPAAADDRKKDLFPSVDSEDRSKAQDYFDIGIIQTGLGETEKAAESFRKAAELNPDIGDELIDDALNDYYLERWSDSRDKFVQARDFFQALDDVRKVQLINDHIRNDFDRDIIFDFDKDQPF